LIGFQPGWAFACGLRLAWAESQRTVLLDQWGCKVQYSQPCLSEK